MAETGSLRLRPSGRARKRLLVGASSAALVLALGANAARGQSVAALMAATRQATSAVTATATAPSAAGTSSAAMAAAAANALRYQTQVNSAQNLAQQAQAAAQAAAAALNQNQALGVIDGLGLGGLQPAVTAPTPAASDPTGVATWQGASLPTASASSPNQVTVTQTASSAILSWTTFNVGQHTTLTFQQQSNGVAQPSWVVLNRVVGVLDPNTGLPLVGTAPAPSQILGSIKASGTVLVLNQNGILFGPTSQVNVNSLIATSLEIGRPLDDITGSPTPRTIAERNAEFLSDGLLGYAEQNEGSVSYGLSSQVIGTDSAGGLVYDKSGPVTVAAGATLTSGTNGYLLLAAPTVTVAGSLLAQDGEIALQSGDQITLTPSTGTATSPDPDVRGLVLQGYDSRTAAPDSVDVESDAILQSARGYVSIGSTQAGAVDVAGVVSATTSINENGYINVYGQTLTIAPDAVLAITPDSSTATLPQDSTSLSDFKPSRIRIGQYSGGAQGSASTRPAMIDIGANSLIYAPGANVSIGADPTGTVSVAAASSPPTSVTVESGAVINVAGLTDVVVPASRNTLEINPVLGNELADAPAFRTGFLNGATVYLDPRLSGVTPNGVAWVGSPLISAAAYAQQVGIPVQELMVAGGNVSIGVSAAAAGSSLATTAAIDIKSGALIDISGGWKTYQAGQIRQTYLIQADGGVIPISQASLDGDYVGIYNGYTVTQSRWGISQSYASPLLIGTTYAGAYTEGQDAGSLRLLGSVAALDGQLLAQAFPGPAQLAAPAVGTASGVASGDLRALQAAPSQLPVGGYLDVQALGSNQSYGGADIAVVDSTDYTPGVSSTVTLNADALTAAGLGQLTLQTSGKIAVQAGATISLDAGGVFQAVAGRSITIDGSILAPSGSISLTTLGGVALGSVLDPEPVEPGFTDITINGRLDVAGLWTNDLGAASGAEQGPGYINGGSITITAAAQQTLYPLGNESSAPNVDVSGSILIDPGASLDLSGGGYVSPSGALTLTATGGNLTLTQATQYYNVAGSGSTTADPKFAILDSSNGFNFVAPLPGAILARISIADGSIRDAGFGGGGTFSLTTPGIAFAPAGGSSAVAAGCGSDGTACGAILPLDFFSRTGFASYAIVSNDTRLIQGIFDSAPSAYSGLLTTQVLSVGTGQTLLLSQSYFSPVLTNAQVAALQSLPSGGSLYSVLSPQVPTDDYDQKPVNLTLGGLLELHVQAGGQVVGAPGASLTLSELYNEGVIDLPGGSIDQTETNYAVPTSVGVSSLTQVFGSPLADGSWSQTAINSFFASGTPYGSLTNAQIAENFSSTPSPVYFLGDLPANTAVLLAAGSVTNLAGVAVMDPRATPTKGVAAGSTYVNGTVINGGSFTAQGVVQGAVKGFVAAPGAVLNLSGAEATFDEPTLTSASASGPQTSGYAPTLVWSNGGALTLEAGGTIGGATILAQGGAPLALGGELTMLDPILYQSDPATPVAQAVSAAAIANAGFASFVALGGLTSSGDVTLVLPRSVFVESAPVSGSEVATAPAIGSGGRLEIDAPYISLSGASQSVDVTAVGSVAANSLILKADAIDITGGVLFDQSIGAATLSASGDIRLIGQAPNASETQVTLVGALAANGDITFSAAQVYPTTGSTFTVSTTGVSSPSASNGGLIAFTSSGPTPATPYSAGGSLSIYAANIDQDGVVRAPLGSLTLGSISATVGAPATVSLALGAGSITSVSADGLDIPYGATTDQVEWYFSPTQSSKLTAPPVGILRLAGAAISTAAGSVVDLSGGGDVYAYEFVPGTGGTRDVLSQVTSDVYSSTNGYQYPDGRQVYAIVPGLSSAAVAAYDPIYSANYSAIYGAAETSTYGPFGKAAGPSGAGLSVYLNAAPGLAAGVYTLLPAQYALLPGGMRVVVDTSASTPPVAASGVAQGVVQSDGTIVTTGYFGVSGLDVRSALPVVFDVQSQAVIAQESQIALTQGVSFFAALAATNGGTVPRLPIDADQLSISALTGLSLAGSIEDTPSSLAATATQAAVAGRGSEIDIAGDALVIEDSAHLPATALAAGSIVLTDTSLEALDATTLLLGGVASQQTDGTTSILATARSIILEPDVTLQAPEILMATGGSGAKITIGAGSKIEAVGTISGESTASYVEEGLDANGSRVQGAQGPFLRVSDGPQRQLVRQDASNATSGALSLGAQVTVSGAAIALESRGGMAIRSTDVIDTSNLELAAGTIIFGTKGSGLLLTPALQGILAGISNVSLESQHAISFASGTYEFQNLTLDTPGLLASKNGAVTLQVSGGLTLTASNAALGACDSTTALACGSGSLTLDAQSITLGSGVLQTYGAGGGVTLAAAQGVFASGVMSLDVAAAPLTFDTPFIGDVATTIPDPANASLTVLAQPKLTVTTTGALVIASSAPASDFTAPDGAPGSGLTFSAASISISGTELRATAGTLSITSASGISISGGAELATPSYAKTFGDAADPTTVSAPGGLLTLTAQAGDIAISDDSALAVGGPQGAAGTITLTAENGSVYAYHGATSDVVALAGVLSAQGGGGSLNLDTGGAFDLSAFAAGAGRQFNGAIAIRTQAGDLDLAQGDTLTAPNVNLTADGGSILQSGTIDANGVNGGSVGLFAADGVHLTSTAAITAVASGYGQQSTQQARGGTVVLGVGGSGAIAVDAGAVIDVSAQNTENRLVPLSRSNGAAYTFVPGDVGGSVTFRAPVQVAGGVETVNVSFAGSVKGASQVVLEGYQPFDLATLAANPGYVGVTVANGAATIDLSATGSGLINPLADPTGPVVQFVQNFNLSASYPNLGGLAAQAGFQARPGIELDYAGSVTLASNWNLGAGVVNVQGAVAAGLMAPDPGLPGQYYVVGATPQALAADEGAILADYTTALYRVGGSFYGAPGDLTIRAAGALTLNGSVTDGFFQFADQTDPNYLNQVLGGGDRVYQAAIAPTTDGSTVSIVFPGRFGLQKVDGVSVAANYVLPNAPYSAAANSAAALGDATGGALITGSGDPLGSAQIFPLLPTASGGNTVVGSWSYQLVAGAALGGGGQQPSANPLAVTAGSAANLTVSGQNVYGYRAVAGQTSFGANLDLADSNGALYSADQSGSPAFQAWLAAFEAQNDLDDSASTTISFVNPTVKATVDQLEAAFAATQPQSGISLTASGDVVASLRVAAQFMAYISGSFSQISSVYVAPREVGISSSTVYAVAPTLVRTGTGSISLAASGAIDLRNGDATTGAPLTLTPTGTLAIATGHELQLGGAPIYTAGALAQLGDATAVDVSTGSVLSVDLSANAVATDNLANQSTQYTLTNSGNVGGVAGAYTYGGGNSDNLIRTGIDGVLIADPAYLQGGGDVSLVAGSDVLSTRDTRLESELGGFGYVAAGSLPSFAGVGDLPWRTGTIGQVVNLLIDPQLFQEGVGALGGGNVSIQAGGAISDLTVVAGGSATTGVVTGASSGAAPALVQLGSGNVIEDAAGSVLGGRLYIAAGNGSVSARGSIASAGSVYVESGEDTFTSIDDSLRIRISDGVVSLSTLGSATIDSIGALGIDTTSSFDQSKGFYAAGSGVSVYADGAIEVDNSNAEIGLAVSAYGQANVYPGSFTAVAFTGDVNVLNSQSGANAVVLYPDATGTLTLLAGGSITAASIAQLDSDPTLLPGAFTDFTFGQGGSATVSSGLDFGFPSVLPDTSDVVLREYHNPSATHAGDAAPDRIAAGGDITGLILSTAKQTRVAAGLDIVDMVFSGQNLAASDITRITAGRDIVGETVLEAAQVDGALLPTLQGNTFVLGGPGSFFVEAGRNAGPFLNSAVVTSGSGELSYGGGIIAVGDLWNPWLPAQSADIYTEFGVANGQNFAGLISTYLNPANFSSLPDYLFLQETGSNGVISADRTQEVYALGLVPWLKSVAATVISDYETAQGIKTLPASPPAYIGFLQTLANGGTATTAQALNYLPYLSDQRLPLIPWLQLNEAPVLMSEFGTLDITYDQAYSFFSSLPTLTQRTYLIPDVYFNELAETSIPTSPSYLNYARGYIAVNTLFPASDGYTANRLDGGPSGASVTVATGNLDLRLSTIQTDQGGDIAILGPGGEVLAGSVVSTSVQAATRYYAGPDLYAGVPPQANHVSVIDSIPPGDEGILTLKGGTIDSFTDQAFLLNQSRAFAEEGGDMIIWSSNSDVNAGQGPRTTADVQPEVVHIDENAYATVDVSAEVSGAGIGAFGEDSSGLAPDVFLLAPRGTVNAGAAGIRSSGNIFIAAFQVENTAGIQAQGTISGAGGPAAVNVAAQTSGDTAATAASQAAAAAAGNAGASEAPVIVVDVLGYLADESQQCSPAEAAAGKCR